MATRALSTSAAAVHAPPIPATPARPRRTISQKLARAWAYLGYGIQMVPPMILPIRPNRRPRGEMQVGDHTVRCYRHWPDDEKLLRDWDELSKRVPGATVFQSPHWQRAVARYADSLGTLRLLTVHRGEKLVGVIPLERKWHGHWRTPGRMTTDYHDPLVEPESCSDTWRAILTAAPQFARSSLRSFTLDLISPGAVCRNMLGRIAAECGFKAVDDITSTGTVIELAPTWDEYLARLGCHDRKELRRKMRKAEERGRARFVVNSTSLAIGYALDNCFGLMERVGGGKGRKTKWLFRPHFNTAAPALSADGRMVVYELFLNDRLAASLIALPQNGKQILWCGAIDRELREWSPGIVLFAMVFRHAIEQGEPAIDLLRGQYPYKYKMGATDRPLHRLALLRTN